MSFHCPHCGGTIIVSAAPAPPSIDATLAAMRAHPDAYLYEHGGPTGQGNGEYSLTNHAPKLTPLKKADVASLLRDGILIRKWADCDGAFILAARKP